MTGPPPAGWAVAPETAGAREIVPGLWRLRLPTGWPGIDHVNAYAIDRAQGDGIVLVDCGTAGDPSCVAALEVALEAAGGRTLEDVRLLVATHAHSDHIGTAPVVVARGGAELWAHPDSTHFTAAFREPERIAAARERRARREGVPEARLEAYRTTREEQEGVLDLVTPGRALRDGDVVDSALGPWEVLETPGHCPSHVCLVQRERRLLLAGDLLCAAFVPWLDYGCSPDPVAEALASLDRVEGLGEITHALPGHGRPITDVPATIALTRAGFARRLDATRAAVAQGPAGAYAIATRMFGEEDDIEATGHLTEVLGYLRHLRLRGEVVRDRADDDDTYIYRGGS
ncbi:MAG TPA: MBL fold metallo-hydrolase [Baekduia sp.]|uniref:MBL fold metallo-hydrolase n=1 Tax=Baekduia sp. TaxID=2600305 RepID=UPI002D791320|nr:MBL fold metallo-hydrolase [Baekduia sp.]HET6507038.1 MBL fold metallo-hydrolase [Baekduia sp.]